MARSGLAGLDKRRLRLWLALFFLALAIPSALLVHQAYRQLKWEAFHQYRGLAEELASRIDVRLAGLITAEEARSFGDYGFLTAAGSPAANYIQRSPLSVYPVAKAFPGLIGYFQVDAEGRFSTPLVPPAPENASLYGIARRELEERMALQGRILQILTQNRLVRNAEGVAATPVAAASAPLQERERFPSQMFESSSNRAYYKTGPGKAAEVRPRSAQSEFDQLDETRAKKRIADAAVVEKFDRGMPSAEMEAPSAASVTVGAPPLDKGQRSLERRASRKEQSALPEVAPVETAGKLKGEPKAVAPARVRIFESELDPFELSLLDSGQFVLYRKVWREGQRFIQGALIDRQAFLSGAVDGLFRDTVLSRISDLVVTYQGKVFAAFNAQGDRYLPGVQDDLRGSVLFQSRLSAPLSDLELIFSIDRLPAGPGAGVLAWLGFTLALVLSGGCWLLYRVGARQIELARQQQDFVSAVSHELKTPLTSIRMYGEILREGWAGEDKKKTYYDYIHDESERLSRLIDNVLQLARMTRNDLRIKLIPMTGSALMDLIRSKVATQVERAGFELRLDCDEAASEAMVKVDADHFAQIIINLVDNALKFSVTAQNKSVIIGCRLADPRTVVFSVRDFGPGIPNGQLKKIFRLFYRSGSEMTRETVGTGIGLALVRQLAQTMGGRVDVQNREPGAEFCVYLPRNASV
jgi:signal transduction histidine kinase